MLYDVFDFIEGARGGRVFVHCSQGVSRSTTLAIAYRMWKEGRAYEDIFAEVKRMRGVANPNIGFICQLLQWHKRRTDEAAVHRLYRIAPQSPSAPLYLVPKLAGVTPAALDPRGAFVLHAGREVFIWIGAQCPEAFATAARRVAGQLHRYEGASEEAQVVVQGQEPEAFWAALSVPSAAQACTPTTAPSSHRNPGKVIAEGPSPEPKYDRDFDLYTRSLNPGAGFGGPGDSCDSARSGRKTPRDQPEHAASPNDRLRKQARSEAMERERERTARSSGSSYSLGTESARARALDFQELAVRRRAPSPPPLRSPPAAAAAPVPAPVPRLALPKASQAAPSIPEAVASEDSELSNSEEEDSDASETDDEATSSEDEEEDGGPAEAVQRPMGVPRLKLG